MIALALAAGACASRPAADLRRRADRDVILITIDTLRSGALGVEAGPSRTPELDRLAGEGLRFPFAHAHATVTLPSHASILTGLFPFQHGYRENAGYRMAPGARTLASRLHESGFATGAFVGAFPLDARFGLTAGFDRYDGRFDDAATGAAFVIPERPATDVVARADAWIAAQTTRWFAWVHVYEPHAPYHPPPPFDREYAAQPYYGEVAAVDAALAPLLTRARTGRRPTLVVVTGDHGEALGDHGEDTHGLFAYESTLRVPLIVAEVGGEEPPDRGDVSYAPAAHVDIVPTILDALGIDPPAGLPGHSLRTAADRARLADRASYFEAMSGAIDYGWAPLTGVLADRRKYIALPIPELYDLARDPSERDNRAPARTDEARALASRLNAFGDLQALPPSAESADTLARLRSLGYASPSGAARRRVTEDDDPKRLVDLDRRMHEAAALDDRGRFEPAVAIYRAVLDRRPAMSAAARHLAFDLWRLGRGAEAVDVLRRAAAADAPTGVRVQLGTYLVEMNEGREAVSVLERAVAQEPTFDALNALGLAYGRAGRGDEAVAVFGRAAQLDPESAVTFENIGGVQLDRGRTPDARTAFERAIALDPRSPQAHVGLALIAARAGDRRTAITHWTQALDAQPDNLDALYDLGVTLARDGQIARAKDVLARFERIAPPAQYGKELANANAILRRR